MDGGKMKEGRKKERKTRKEWIEDAMEQKDKEQQKE